MESVGKLDLPAFVRELRSLLRGRLLPEDPCMAFLLICVIIFFGSLLAGLVPFSIPVTERQVNLLAAFGAGLLVSTALAVITPEGMEAFHEASEGTELPPSRSLANSYTTLHIRDASCLFPA